MSDGPRNPAGRPESAEDVPLDAGGAFSFPLAAREVRWFRVTIADPAVQAGAFPESGDVTVGMYTADLRALPAPYGGSRYAATPYGVPGTFYLRAESGAGGVLAVQDSQAGR